MVIFCHSEKPSELSMQSIIRPCFQKCGNTLLIISGVDAGAHHVAFGAVDQLVLIFLMAVIILAEYQIYQPPFFIYKRKAVNLVFPDNIVGFLLRWYLRLRIQDHQSES